MGSLIGEFPPPSPLLVDQQFQLTASSLAHDLLVTSSSYLKSPQLYSLGCIVRPQPPQKEHCHGQSGEGTSASIRHCISSRNRVNLLT
ncbi:hypothetical protein Zmor_014474 [Zophobas morio]|uniref:Uncharacterized protein n=1 Tax=Zophobas morio TaxID=2755281 RepID=A0AA38MFP1_9CUCU|nr:hypothetical protein Zmor_014474 [Zophobas morio]